MDSHTSDSACLKIGTKRLKTEGNFQVKMNETYHENTDLLSEAFCNGKALELDNEAKVLSEPFTCCILPNFVQPDEYLIRLKNELSKIRMEKRINDLYQFLQSKDLGDCDKPGIYSFKSLLRREVLEWMRKITKIPLTEKIDISSSCYAYTDHLLCHDDELEGRRIAFIYYLVPDWNEEDGGSLDLFNTVDGQPNEISKSIVPKWNNFVFFEVSPISYHQVSEVLASKKRIALSGWFHGPPLKPSVPVKETILFKEPSYEQIDVMDWINPVYLDAQTQLDIRETFEENSEISLPDFLKTRKYEEVCKALADSKISWNRKGPPNHRNVYEANINDIPLILRECQALFMSEAFLLILSNFTALKLHPACEEDAQLGKVCSCIRKWSPGSYTLLHNQSFSQVCSLNALMYFNCTDWDAEFGGYSSFVADEENDELLRIEPTCNSLALVYITEGTSSFVKYINSRAKNRTMPFFHDILCIYLEGSVDNI